MSVPRAKCYGVSAPISQRLHFQMPTAPFHTSGFLFVSITKNSLLPVGFSQVSSGPLKAPLLSPISLYSFSLGELRPPLFLTS